MSELTKQKQILVETDGHILALGGPGSGKTYMGLLRADKEIRSGRLQRGQKILFLSFARATITRIAQQAGKLISESHIKHLEINTYHGFAWNLIRSHGYLLKSGNIKLLPPPEAAARLAEVSRELLPIEKRRLFDAEGFLHFDLFAFFATELLSRSRILCHIISDAYPIIILDEFQDTNLDEWKMIQTLGQESHLMALADAEQRIYEFRGADPKRISEFVTQFKPNQFDFGLENNRSNGTDIVAFGNDLLTGANKGKIYSDVAIVKYGFYRGRNQHFALKASLLEAVNRQCKSNNRSWSIAVLVPTKRMMLSVSDCLSAADDRLPVINHDVLLDCEGPSLAAVLIAGILEGGLTVGGVLRRIILDLRNHIRGRNGSDGPNKNELRLAGSLTDYLQTGIIRGKNRQEIVKESLRIAQERQKLELSGNPEADWLAVRQLMSASNAEAIARVADEAKYLRLLHRGAALRTKLNELWRMNNSYKGAITAVQEALLQEHFSASTRTWRGIHVLTVHKSKGKEFDEVLIYEGLHNGKIVRANATQNDVAQALLSLRVAVTRAKYRATILTPRTDVCLFLK